MESQQYKSAFKTAEGEAAYIAAYDRALKAWPVSYETLLVPTTYGDTHVVTAGPREGEPLLLIPGKGASATMWAPNIVALSKKYRVYALDIIGDVGKSKPTSIFSDRGAFADWMTQVLDELKIEMASMVGHSMGGFLTISYALERPERLRKIVLLSPAATFSPFSKTWLFKAMLTGAFGIDYFIRKFLRSLSSVDSVLESEWIAQGIIGIKNERFQMKFPPSVLPDEDLRSFKIPTLLIIGENEIINRDSPARTVERAKTMLENIQTEVIPNAIHLINMEEPELVNSRILGFLSESD